MATTSLQGTPCHTNGNLPGLGNPSPHFCVVNGKLEEVCLDQMGDNNKLIYFVPSLDTHLCAITSKALNEMAADLKNTDCFRRPALCPTTLLQTKQTEKYNTTFPYAIQTMCRGLWRSVNRWSIKDINCQSGFYTGLIQ